MHKWEPLFPTDTCISVKPETLTFDADGCHSASYIATTSVGNSLTFDMNITSDMSPEEMRDAIARSFGPWPPTNKKDEKERKVMEPKKVKNYGNGLYANLSASGPSTYDLGTIYGDHLYLVLAEWDGNAEAVIRLITKTYGWIETNAYHKLRYLVYDARGLKKKENEAAPIKKAKKIKVYPSIYIKDVIFNGPATIIFWSDDIKTVVKCQENEAIDHEKGLAMAISKRVLGNESNFNNELKRWLEERDD